MTVPEQSRWFLSWGQTLCCNLILFGIVSTGARVLAQVVPDTTLPLGERSQVSTGPLLQINSGAVRGSNLFHSFEQFSLAQGETAWFNNAATITNIISRVTGGLPSNINGVLQANGSANLFFINPSGVLFGPNASLNIGGNFLVTTASAIQFGNQGIYSATNPTTPTLLTVNPSALLFNQLATQAIASQARLQVPMGQSLALVGGAISLNGSTLLAPGGRVELGGLAGQGIVNLDSSGSSLHLNFEASQPSLADVMLANHSQVNVRTGGSIGINAQTFSMADGSILRGGIAAGEGAPGSKAGDIDLNVPGMVVLTDGSFIANSTLGVGDGGNVNVTAGSVLLKDGSQIGANTGGVGNSGTVTIRSLGSVILDGEAPNGVSGGFYSEVEAGATGNSGGIKIFADSVLVTNGALLSARTLGNGNAGNIEITAPGAVRFDGVGPVDQFASGAYVGVGAQPFGTYGGRPGFGNSGDLIINAGSLSIANGARLDASDSPLSRGNAGRIQLQIMGAVNLDGDPSNQLADPGGIYSYIGSGKNQPAVGNSGGITLTAQSLSLKNGAAFVASTYGQGNAGDINLHVSGAVTLDGQGSPISTGIFSSVTKPAQGNSGQIALSVGSLSVTNGAAIASSVLGRGKAANLTIAATGAVSFDGVSFDGVAADSFPSGIFSRVGPNATGNSTINVTAQSLSLTNGAEFQANTLGATMAGGIRISTADDMRIAGINAPAGLPSGLFSTTGKNASGNGGDIDVNGRSLLLQDGGVISSQSAGVGNAGSIAIRLRDRLQANDGQILTSSAQSAGGDIAIAARIITLRGDSDITTSVLSGIGGGGNITLGARAIVALDDSDILAFSRDGSGGNITLNTPAFFGFRYQPEDGSTNIATLNGNDRVDVNASGKLRSGTIILPNVTLQSNLAPLPLEVVDTNNLIAHSCIARNPRQGSFLVTGVGGLPNQPDDLATVPFPTYEMTPGEATNQLPVQQQTDSQKQERETVENRFKDTSSSPEADMVEIDGIYQLANGSVVLGRSCHPF